MEVEVEEEEEEEDSDSDDDMSCHVIYEQGGPSVRNTRLRQILPLV